MSTPLDRCGRCGRPSMAGIPHTCPGGLHVVDPGCLGADVAAGAPAHMGTDPARGPWIRTFTGRRFYVTTPRPEDFCIEDIAQGLCGEGRYSNQCHQWYTVAEHSVRVSWAVPKPLQLQALLHDRTEAYFKDIPSPIKRTVFLDGYRALEKRAELVSAQTFGLPGEMDPDVHFADRLLLATEKRDLFPTDGPDDMPADSPRLKGVIYPWSREHARRMFLARYQELMLMKWGPRSELGLNAPLEECGWCGVPTDLTGRAIVAGLWDNRGCAKCGGAGSYHVLLDVHF